MSDGVPVVALADPADVVLPVLLELQGALLKHPEAAQAIIGLLAREGRRVAATPQGAELQALLTRSDLLRRLWRTWEATSLWMFDATSDTVLPSGYVDALFCAAATEDLEPLLARLVADREALAAGQRDGR